MKGSGAALYWIAGITWLTGVGEPFLTWLGGAKAIGADLPAAIMCDEGPHGAIFQLGPQPITGEAGVVNADLRLYHALGNRLQPHDFHVKDEDLGSHRPRGPYRSFGPVFDSNTWEDCIGLGTPLLRQNGLAAIRSDIDRAGNRTLHMAIA